MTWDVKQDTQTGDWEYTGHRDVMGVDGHAHTYQRILTRLRIPRGSYDSDTGNVLGSFLEDTMRYGFDRLLPEAPTLIREALSGMLDITVINVDVRVDENSPHGIKAKISYVYVDDPDEASVSVGDTPAELFIADISI